jgi:hypothetical protein
MAQAMHTASAPVAGRPSLSLACPAAIGQLVVTGTGASFWHPCLARCQVQAGCNAPAALQSRTAQALLAAAHGAGTSMPTCLLKRLARPAWVDQRQHGCCSPIAAPLAAVRQSNNRAHVCAARRSGSARHKSGWIRCCIPDSRCQHH